MTTENNRGEGMAVDFASLLQHIDEQISAWDRNLTNALRTMPLDFREQNLRLAEFQAAVRAKEVLLGRTLIDGHGIARKVAIESAGIEAVAAVLGRRPSFPTPGKAVDHPDDGAAALAKKLAPEKT